MAPTTRSRKRKSEENSLVEDEASLVQLEEPKRPKKLPVRAKDNEAEDDSEAAAKTSVEAQAAGTLKVFGDDDEVEAPQKSSNGADKAKAAAEHAEQSEEDSDDDAAPEAVSTQQAASQVKKSNLAAQKAAQEQAAAQKRKRQQRDALFREQAEERKKVEEAKKPDSRPSALGPSDEDAVQKGPTLYGSRKRMDRIQLPEVLPAEFLTDDSSAEEDGADDHDGALSGPIKRRKVSTVEKHMARQNKAPRDLAVGTTVYRVAKKVDERLAPKAKKFSTGSREALLKRNRTATSSKGGFFKR